MDDAWEPSLIALRGRLERVFEDGLRRAVGQVALDLPRTRLTWHFAT